MCPRLGSWSLGRMVQVDKSSAGKEKTRIGSRKDTREGTLNWRVRCCGNRLVMAAKSMGSNLLPGISGPSQYPPAPGGTC